MMHRLLPWLLLILLVLGVAIGYESQAEDKGTMWLAMAALAEESSYNILGLTQTNGKRASFSLQQRGNDFTLTYTDAAHLGTTLVGKNGVVTLTDANGHRQQSTTAPAPLSALLAHYSAIVTQRDVHVVKLSVRRHPWSRPVMTLSLDATTGLPIQKVSFDAQGRETQRTEYSHVTVLPPASCACCAATSDTLATAEARAHFTWWAPRRVPAGFALTGYTVAPCACGCGDQVLQATYSDGLRTLAVFESEIGPHGCCAGAACGGDHHGACVAGQFPDAHFVARTVGRHTIAVLGDLDDRTLQQVAESVRMP